MVKSRGFFAGTFLLGKKKNILKAIEETLVLEVGMEEVQKDMIIKLRLKDSDLQSLIRITEDAGLSLPQLFEYFIQDLVDENADGADTIEDWLYLRTGCQNEAEYDNDEDMFENVKLTNNQLDMMNLLDLIMGN